MTGSSLPPGWWSSPQILFWIVLPRTMLSTNLCRWAPWQWLWDGSLLSCLVGSNSCKQGGEAGWGRGKSWTVMQWWQNLSWSHEGSKTGTALQWHPIMRQWDQEFVPTHPPVHGEGSCPYPRTVSEEGLCCEPSAGTCLPTGRMSYLSPHGRSWKAHHSTHYTAQQREFTNQPDHPNALISGNKTLGKHNYVPMMFKVLANTQQQHDSEKDNEYQIP